MITYSKNGCWGIEGVDLTKLNDSKVYGALYKLHKYEESGLEPEQLSDIDELYREKCEEVNRLNIKFNTSCECHMPTHNMNFGQALMMIKEGKKVARSGWNGKGMFLFLAEVIDFETRADISCAKALDSTLVCPTIVMKTADNHLCMGWLASQTDMLAEDWEVVE